MTIESPSCPMLTPPPATAHRYPALDAVRGLAAASVVGLHCSQLTPGLLVWSLTPLVNGHNAVVMFFILSGFVLSLPVYRGTKLFYGLFLMRRLCRLQLPYMAATALSIGLGGVLPHPALAIDFRWRAIWSHALNWQEIGLHLSLIGAFEASLLNPVIWSLIHEMRFSLAFPLFIWLGRRPAWLVLLMCPLLTALAEKCNASPLWSMALAPSLLGSLHYAGIFLFGVLIARHHTKLIARVSTWPNTGRAGLLLLGTLAYLRPENWLTQLHPSLAVFDWTAALGSGAILVSLICSPRASELLCHPFLAHLGRLSFSLYLVHALVLATAFNLLGTLISPTLIVALSVPLMLLAAELFYQSVERPTLAWSKRIGERVSQG